MDAFESGSTIRDWEHSPNLTPRGYEIKKDELYVLNGDTLIKAYHLLMNQRTSSLLSLSKIPPTNVALYEEYLSMSKYINLVLYHILHSVPLANILAMQEETRVEEQRKPPPKRVGLTLKEILEKFHLSEGGKDELNPPSSPTDGEPTK